MNLKKYKKEIILGGTFLLAILIIITLDRLSRDYEEEEKIEIFVSKLSQAYNSRVEFENRGVKDEAFKDKFLLYTSDGQNLKIRVNKYSIYELSCKGRSYDDYCINFNKSDDYDLYFIEFERVNSNELVVNYYPEEEPNEVLLTIGIYSEHILYTDNLVSAPNNLKNYKFMISFEKAEILNNPEREGTKAGEGIYQYHKNGDRSYIEGIVDHNSIFNQNEREPVKESLSDRLRNRLVKTYNRNSDIISPILDLLALISFIGFVIDIILIFIRRKKSLLPPNPPIIHPHLQNT